MWNRFIKNPPLPPTDSPRSGLSVVIWLAGNCLALAIAAGRLPLSARYPEPAEALTAELMLATQVILVALLAPTLIRSRGMAILTAISGAVFLELAAVLSQVPQIHVVIAAIFLATWTVCVGVTVNGLPRQWQSALHSAVVLITLLGPVLSYFAAETQQKNLATSVANSTPAMAGLSLFDVSDVRIKTWVVVLLVGLPGILYAGGRKAKTSRLLRRQVIHR